MYKLLPTKQAAKVLNIRTSTLYRWAEAGEINSIKSNIGKGLRTQYYFDVANFLLKNGIDPKIYLNQAEVQHGSRSTEGTVKNIRDVVTATEDTRGKSDNNDL